MRVLKWIWQLPQNLIGFCISRFCKKSDRGIYLAPKLFFCGVSLGQYIIFDRRIAYLLMDSDIKHERGHSKQSLILGPLYLIVIGIPSLCGNIWDRIFHRDWACQDALAWYYRLPWEHWANILGDNLGT